jgi:hypothetical protein
MLSVYTRHYPPCQQTDIHYRRCHCPKWVRGLLDTGGFIRRSAHTRNWVNAEMKSRQMERGMEEKPVVIEIAVTTESAIQAYVAEQEARNVSWSTLNQSKCFLERNLLVWCRERRLLRLNQIRTPHLREFRRSWDLRSTTAGRRHQRMRACFLFSIDNGWLQINPMNGLKKPIPPCAVPTNYFNRREFKRIIEATYEYEYGGRHRLLVPSRQDACPQPADALERSCD